MKPNPVINAAPDLRAIDAFRGYAFLLVLACHVVTAVPSMVWPLRRIMFMGNYGVQLFFLASALTLLMSWHRTSAPLAEKCRVFFVHRFFRIAPLYVLAIAYYWFFFANQPQEFDLARLVSFLFFYNAWSPYLIPTVGGWMPVPGGWSISVEFCFYLVFPLLATLVSNRKRALLFVLASYILLILVPLAGFNLFTELPRQQVDNFLYFSFPNQLIIFSLGFLLYEILKSDRLVQAVRCSRVNEIIASLLAVILLVLLAWSPAGKFVSTHDFLPPVHVLATLIFFAWAIVLVIKPGRVIVNPLVIAIGKLSFSMYILHFSMLHVAKFLLSFVWHFSIEGVASIVYSFVLMATALVLTCLCSMLTSHYIERPGIRLGKQLLAHRPRAAGA